MLGLQRLLSVYSILLLCVVAAPRLSTAAVGWTPDVAFRKRQTIPPRDVLDNFQVYEPILTPSGTSDQYGCVYAKTLMVHDFAFSYGTPFVGMKRAIYL